jgi:hypothetical protein
MTSANPPDPGRKDPPPPGGPVFFLSYSRTTRLNTEVGQLFEDLTDRVQQIVPLRPGEQAGFMDVHMEAGEEWNDELLRNLATCQVFVALLSGPYLRNSIWCPMEWDLFFGRQVTPRAGGQNRPHAKAIIPVWWTPFGEPLPPMVGQVQCFALSSLATRRQKALYDSEGMLGMLDMDPPAYKAAVWTLARQIYKMRQDFDVAPDPAPKTDGLRRSFWDDDPGHGTR